MNLNKIDETKRVHYLYDIKQKKVSKKINNWIEKNKSNYKIIDINIIASSSDEEYEFRKDILIIYDII